MFKFDVLPLFGGFVIHFEPFGVPTCYKALLIREDTIANYRIRTHILKTSLLSENPFFLHFFGQSTSFTLLLAVDKRIEMFFQIFSSNFDLQSDNIAIFSQK